MSEVTLLSHHRVIHKEHTDKNAGVRNVDRNKYKGSLFTLEEEKERERQRVDVQVLLRNWDSMNSGRPIEP